MSKLLNLYFLMHTVKTVKMLTLEVGTIKAAFATELAMKY